MIETNLINLKAHELTKASEEFLERVTKQALGDELTEEIAQELKSLRGLIWSLSKIIKGEYKFRQEFLDNRIHHSERLDAKIVKDTAQDGVDELDFSIFISHQRDENWESYVQLTKTTSYEPKTPKQARDVLKKFLKKLTDESPIEEAYLRCWELFFEHLDNLKDSYLVELSRVQKDPHSSLVLAIRPKDGQAGCYSYFEFQRQRLEFDFEQE